MLWIYAFAAACIAYNAAYLVHCANTRQTRAAVGAALLSAVSLAMLTLA